MIDYTSQQINFSIYMLESNALGDASGRREPSTPNLLWLSPSQQNNEEVLI